MAEEFVTIATFLTLPEAEAARLHLEMEGFPATLVDAEIVSMDWLLGNAVGNIKLQVPPSRAAAATALLDQVAAERRERREAVQDDEWFETDAATCLACGANLPSDVDRCDACGWSYTDPDEG